MFLALRSQDCQRDKNKRYNGGKIVIFHVIFDTFFLGSSSRVSDSVPDADGRYDSTDNEQSGRQQHAIMETA